MKRGALLILSLFLLIILFLPCTEVTASAEGEENVMEQLNSTVEELIKALDTKQLEKYLDSLTIFQDISLKEKLSSVISGDFSLDYGNLAHSLLSVFWENIQALFPAFAVILSISLLCSVLSIISISTLFINFLIPRVPWDS